MAMRLSTSRSVSEPPGRYCCSPVKPGTAGCMIRALLKSSGALEKRADAFLGTATANALPGDEQSQSNPANDRLPLGHRESSPSTWKTVPRMAKLGSETTACTHIETRDGSMLVTAAKPNSVDATCPKANQAARVSAGVVDARPLPRTVSTSSATTLWAARAMRPSWLRASSPYRCLGVVPKMACGGRRVEREGQM